jgi:hypothetical protein
LLVEVALAEQEDRVALVVPVLADIWPGLHNWHLVLQPQQ